MLGCRVLEISTYFTPSRNSISFFLFSYKWETLAGGYLAVSQFNLPSLIVFQCQSENLLRQSQERKSPREIIRAGERMKASNFIFPEVTPRTSEEKKCPLPTSCPPLHQKPKVMGKLCYLSLDIGAAMSSARQRERRKSNQHLRRARPRWFIYRIEYRKTDWQKFLFARAGLIPGQFRWWTSDAERGILARGGE